MCKQAHTHTHTIRPTQVEVFCCAKIYAKSMESRFALKIIKMPRLALESMQRILVVEYGFERFIAKAFSCFVAKQIDILFQRLTLFSARTTA